MSIKHRAYVGQEKYLTYLVHFMFIIIFNIASRYILFLTYTTDIIGVSFPFLKAEIQLPVKKPVRDIHM